MRNDDFYSGNGEKLKGEKKHEEVAWHVARVRGRRFLCPDRVHE